MRNAPNPYPRRPDCRGQLLGALTAAVLGLAGGNAQAAIGDETDLAHPCGSLMNAYGPYDYRIFKGKIEVTRVEQYHFTPLVERLIKPMFQHLAADFDYTLRAIPNHHRALVSMARHSEKLNDPLPPGAGRTTECYFDRAMRFAPTDHTVRLIYAGHLLRIGQKARAMQQLATVEQLVEANPFGLSSLGLVYLEAGEPDKALQQAHAAMALGLQRQELRDRLVKAGKWQEPAAPAAPAVPASAVAAEPAAPAAGQR